VAQYYKNYRYDHNEIAWKWSSRYEFWAASVLKLKEWLKSANIWQNYYKKQHGTFSWLTHSLYIWWCVVVFDFGDC